MKKCNRRFFLGGGETVENILMLDGHDNSMQKSYFLSENHSCVCFQCKSMKHFRFFFLILSVFIFAFFHRTNCCDLSF